MSIQIFKTFTKNISAGKITGIFLTLLFVNFSILHATQFKLIRTPQTGNTIKLTVPAQIRSITRDVEKTTYTIWRNGKSYLTVNYTHNPKGILPPGTYIVLASPGGSVSIILNTDILPETIILWGRQNALVKPLWEGNCLVIVKPTTITSATYDGTKGMSIEYQFVVSPPQFKRFLYFLSPHNINNPGPKVLDGAGRTVAKTLVGQTLPAGIYRIWPERGTADGIVYGEIVVTVK